MSGPGSGWDPSSWGFGYWGPCWALVFMHAQIYQRTNKRTVWPPACSVACYAVLFGCRFGLKNHIEQFAPSHWRKMSPPTPDVLMPKLTWNRFTVALWASRSWYLLLRWRSMGGCWALLQELAVRSRKLCHLCRSLTRNTAFWDLRQVTGSSPVSCCPTSSLVFDGARCGNPIVSWGHHAGIVAH